MKTRLRDFCRLSLLAGLAATASAAEIQGVLMDKMCSMKALKEGQQASRTHTRDCALMPDCQKSGYGVLTPDGRFISLDDAGNAKALAALKASGKKEDLRVQVTGDLQGDTIKASNLKLL